MFDVSSIWIQKGEEVKQHGSCSVEFRRFDVPSLEAKSRDRRMNLQDKVLSSDLEAETSTADESTSDLDPPMQTHVCPSHGTLPRLGLRLGDEMLALDLVLLQDGVNTHQSFLRIRVPG